MQGLVEKPLQEGNSGWEMCQSNLHLENGILMTVSRRLRGFWGGMLSRPRKTLGIPASVVRAAKAWHPSHLGLARRGKHSQRMTDHALVFMGLLFDLDRMRRISN